MIKINLISHINININKKSNSLPVKAKDRPQSDINQMSAGRRRIDDDVKIKSYLAIDQIWIEYYNYLECISNIP